LQIGVIVERVIAHSFRCGGKGSGGRRGERRPHGVDTMRPRVACESGDDLSNARSGNVLKSLSVRGACNRQRW